MIYNFRAVPVSKSTAFEEQKKSNGTDPISSNNNVAII